MKRPWIVLLLTLAALCASPSAGAFPSLHKGSHGHAVKDAQWLESGHNRYGVRTYRGRIDGVYGSATSAATKAAKYRLGYARPNGRFGDTVYRILTGKRKLDRGMLVARKRRIKFLRAPRRGSVYLVGSCRASPPKPYVLTFARWTSAEYGHPLACVSGKRYSHVLGTHRLSMHVYGAAADLATGTVRMNLLVGQAALRAAGMPAARSYLTFSPVSYGFWYGGVNILFHTFVGGNHWNHVHVGLWRLPSRRRSLATSSSTPPVGEEVIGTGGLGAWHVVYRYGMNVPDARTRAGILAVKKGLIANGYSTGIDLSKPVFGNYVRDRTIAFQRDQGIGADGVVGPHTARALFATYSRRYAGVVPRDLTCKQKTLESANDPVAQGVLDPGDEGIVQIHLAFHPDVTLAEAWDPAFALRWQTDKIVGYHDETHDWQGAIAAWNIGLFYAKEWVTAGKPTSGKVLSDGIDIFTRASRYVGLVEASTC